MSINRLVGRIAVAMFGLILAMQTASAQSALPQDNRSISVATGLTYQTIAPADNSRHLVEIQNNNTNTDNCWINVDGVVANGNTTATNVTTAAGATVTAAKASILLAPGQPYSRYYPTAPNAPIVGTCASSGDSLYASIR